MNICMISREYPPYTDWGGISRYTHLLSNGMSQLGHNVSIISLKTSESPNYEVDSKIKIHRIDNNKLNMIIGLRKSEYCFSISSFLKFRELLKNNNFDIVHSNKLDPLLVFLFTKYIKKIPSVLSMHTPYFIHGPMDILQNKNVRFHNRYIMYPSYSLAEDLTAKFASKVIAVSNSLAQTLYQRNISQKNMVVIHNGIDTNYFCPGKYNKILKKDLNFKKYVILFVGRLELRKGPDILIRSIPLIKKELKDVSCVLVGDCRNASFEEYLKKLTYKLGCEENIVFYGRVSEKKLLELYEMCDILVVPSRYESFGLTVVEGMSMKKPVVAANIGGMKEIIDNNINGYLFESGNFMDLSEKILKLLHDEEMKMYMGINARKKIIKCYNAENMINKTLELYYDVSSR